MMAEYQKYEEYKDSGEEWIGHIPAHWDIQRGKNVLTLLERPVTDSDEVITCFRDGEVTLRKKRREDGFTISLKEIGYQGIEPGDLVVHGMDGFAGAIGVSDSRGKGTPVLNVMDSSHNKRFIMYFLRSAAYKDVFMALSTGIRVRSCDLRWNKLSVFSFVLPPKQEQDIIATYIDTQLQKIDSVIAEAKASIDEYKSWKASIVYEAVTKGLDPNAEMKDSGMEYVNNIPCHWNIIKLKYATWVRARLGWRALKAEEYVDSGYPLLSAFNIVNNKLDFSSVNYINQFRYDESPEIKLALGDVLLLKDGAGIGKCAIVEELPQESTVNGSIALLTVTAQEILYPKFLYYYFLSPVFQQYIDRLRMGMGVPHLFQSEINNIRIPLPTLNEQEQIVKLLDTKTSQIDSLISEKEALIADLEAYKKSLIFEVVTGKRKVTASEKTPAGQEGA